VRKDRGAYALFIAGVEIEAWLRASAQAPTDDFRNPPIDADLLFATESLTIAHAGLIAVFPDIAHLATELDQYRQQAEAVDALRNRVLDPVMKRLAAAERLFDGETEALTRMVDRLDDSITGVSDPPTPTRGATAAKHAWLRGVLASIGNYILHQLRAIGRTARDTAVKEAVSSWIRNPDALSAAILSFLNSAGDQLIALATSLQHSFGWLHTLLSMVGLG